MKISTFFMRIFLRGKSRSFYGASIFLMPTQAINTELLRSLCDKTGRMRKKRRKKAPPVGRGYIKNNYYFLPLPEGAGFEPAFSASSICFSRESLGSIALSRSMYFCIVGLSLAL